MVSTNRTGVWISLFLVAGISAGCSYGTRVPESERSAITDAVPKAEPRSKYGNPESYVVAGKRYRVMNDNREFSEEGIASWYGKKFHGRRTSSGETYNMYAMTAAHKTLLLPAYVEVTNLENGGRAIVRVNDRGPFHENRIIDLSYAAAQKLGIAEKGTALVRIRVVEPGDSPVNNAADQATSVSAAPVKDLAKAFYIQVGAFSQLDNAKRLLSKLAVFKNPPAKISPVVIDNKSMYRIRIGPLVEVSDADKIVSHLHRLGESDYRIVAD